MSSHESSRADQSFFWSDVKVSTKFLKSVLGLVLDSSSCSIIVVAADDVFFLLALAVTEAIGRWFLFRFFLRAAPPAHVNIIHTLGFFGEI